MNIPNTPAADRYASLKIQRDMIDSELEFLKTQIVETGKDLVEGIDYNVTTLSGNGVLSATTHAQAYMDHVALPGHGALRATAVSKKFIIHGYLNGAGTPQGMIT